MRTCHRCDPSFDAPSRCFALVAIYFDNIQLFSAPFSKFKPGLLPGAYWLTKNGILVRFDFANDQLLVVTPEMNLAGPDNVNGVDVELMIGSDVATENIMMKPSHFNTAHLS